MDCLQQNGVENVARITERASVNTSKCRPTSACIWWGLEGHCALRAPSTKSDAEFKYCFQLDRLRAAIDEKLSESINWYWNSVTFHQDNARPHLSLQTRQKLLQPAEMSY